MRSAAARRRRARGSAWRSRRRAPRAGCAPPSGCPSATGCWCAASSTGSPADAAGLEQGDLLVAAAGRAARRLRRRCFDALEAAAGALALTVVRGTEEREVDRTLQFVKPCARMGVHAELRLSRLPYRRHRLRQVDAAGDPRPGRGPRRASASSSARSRASRRARSRCACGRSRRRASSRARRSPRCRRASSTR